jgi:hypothetical protein
LYSSGIGIAASSASDISGSGAPAGVSDGVAVRLLPFFVASASLAGRLSSNILWQVG